MNSIEGVKVGDEIALDDHYQGLKIREIVRVTEKFAIYNYGVVSYKVRIRDGREVGSDSGFRGADHWRFANDRDRDCARRKKLITYLKHSAEYGRLSFDALERIYTIVKEEP